MPPVPRRRQSARTTPRRWGILCALVALALVLAGCARSDDRTGVSLILKTQTNPYFVSMKQSAQKEADRLGVRLSVAAGTADGDTQNQINAIYTAIARGDKGILITSNGDAVNAALRKARDAGLYVAALDTPLNPADTANTTFATDNQQAGRVIGQYAAAKLGGKDAVIAMLDLYDDQVISVDIQRDHGFLEGMGIDPKSKNLNAQEDPKGSYTGGKGGKYTIACHQPTDGAIDGGRTAMEQCLSANPDINVVYTINEPAGRGAFAALVADNKTDQARIYTIDGSCQGVGDVKAKTFAADAAQYPGEMAAKGVEAIATYARGEAPPAATEGKTFFDTGTALVVADPVSGLPSQSPQEALAKCWGG